MPHESPRVSFIVHIDGASRGNPGPASYAAIIETADGKPVISMAKKLGNTTNNFAEYQALLAALEFAAAHRPQKVIVFSDSELLVRQIQGRYKVKSESLKPLHAQAMALIEGLTGFSITHVLRGKNREADHLANLALDGKC